MHIALSKMLQQWKSLMGRDRMDIGDHKVEMGVAGNGL
jgi:hypothetical protein